MTLNLCSQFICIQGTRKYNFQSIKSQNNSRHNLPEFLSSLSLLFFFDCLFLFFKIPFSILSHILRQASGRLSLLPESHERDLCLNPTPLLSALQRGLMPSVLSGSGRLLDFAQLHFQNFRYSSGPQYTLRKLSQSFKYPLEWWHALEVRYVLDNSYLNVIHGILSYEWVHVENSFLVLFHDVKQLCNC